MGNGKINRESSQGKSKESADYETGHKKHRSLSDHVFVLLVLLMNGFMFSLFFWRAMPFPFMGVHPFSFAENIFTPLTAGNVNGWLGMCFIIFYWYFSIFALIQPVPKYETKLTKVINIALAAIGVILLVLFFTVPFSFATISALGYGLKLLLTILASAVATIVLYGIWLYPHF